MTIIKLILQHLLFVNNLICPNHNYKTEAIMISRLIQNCYRFSKITNLDNYYYRQPNQIATIFATKNVQWTQNHIKTQSQAMARGMLQHKFISGDVFLVRLPIGYQSQKLVIRMAASNVGAKVRVSKANSMQELEKQLLQSKARAFFFNSFDKLGDTTTVDAMYHLVPEMVRAPNDRQLQPQKFFFLRYLIQVDNYPYKGTFNYQKFIRYGLKTDYTMSFTSNQTPILLEKSSDRSRPIVITDPCDDLAFRAGVLNCTVNGNLLVCISPEQSRVASQKFNHKVDFIVTEPMAQLHSDNRVFVRAGSKLYEKHPQRHEIVL